MKPWKHLNPQQSIGDIALYVHGEDGQVTINELWEQKKNYRWCAEDVTLNECVKVL